MTTATTTTQPISAAAYTRAVYSKYKRAFGADACTLADFRADLAHELAYSRRQGLTPDACFRGFVL